MSAGFVNEAQGVRRGEFEKLAFEHLDSLYRTALRMTRSAADAEDLVQDVYLNAYRSFHQFRPDSNFRAWIFKILRNQFINLYRRTQRQPAMVDLTAVAEAADGADAEFAMAHPAIPRSARHSHNMSGRLEEALGKLNEDCRMALILAYVEGFRYRQIAQIMNCPIRTLMSRLHRSRQKLRHWIEDQPYPRMVPRGGGNPAAQVRDSPGVG